MQASAFQRLAIEFDLRQDDIAKRVGKNRATVANAMRLLDLAPVLQNRVSQSLLSSGHAKVLLSVKDLDAQAALGNEVIKRKLSVRATEKLVADFHNGGESSGKGKGSTKKLIDTLPPQYKPVVNALRERFATHVSLQHTAKKGKIEIEYYGDDDLNRVLDILGINGDF